MSIKKAKSMRSILLKGFGFTELAEAEDSESNELAIRCIYRKMLWVQHWVQHFNSSIWNVPF